MDKLEQLIRLHTCCTATYRLAIVYKLYIVISVLLFQDGMSFVVVEGTQWADV